MKRFSLKKITAIIISILMGCSLCSHRSGLSSAINGARIAPVFMGAVYAENDNSIVILYENDVHCAVEGYSKLAAMKNELKESYANVGIVSSGDFIQGGTLGAVSKGEYIINLMNKVGYDAIALGNHEFDYRLPRLEELNAISNTKFISCNFQKIGEEKPYFDSYRIVSYGDIDVAYIGVTTPNTIASSSPAQFKNENGEFIFTFNESNLYDLLQKNIDEVKRAGADYIIALSHVGYDEQGTLVDVTDMIENTSGLDVVLDAHSHSIIEEKIIKDKRGEDVLLSSTGTKFQYVGQLTIKNGAFDTKLIEVAGYDKTDSIVDEYIAEVNENYAQLGSRVIGESKVDLITHDKDGNRLVRNGETNLGDLCSDALREVTNADISFVNGGGLRSSISAGPITFNDIFSVFPFNNQVVTAEVSGKVLLDFLEMALMSYPAEDGSFPHVSGMTFSVNKSIESSVKTDENDFFESVEGDYRIYNVKVFDKESGEYKPLDLNRKYIFTSFNYFLIEYGSGMKMFSDAKILDAEGILDVELFENYIVNYLGGVIGEEYAETKANITFTDGVIADTIQGGESSTIINSGCSCNSAIYNNGIYIALAAVFAVLTIYRKKKTV